MKKQALPVWALPAAGAAIGGTVGLLGGINIDDPRITPSIRAKKLLRCLLLGGVTGLGLEGMRQGGKLIFKQSSYKPKGYLLRDLLLKQAEEDPAADPAADLAATAGAGSAGAGTGNSWFSGDTWGVPNHYLVGGGLGALGGLTLYHLLNDKRKRRASGYLGSALAGLGVGALGAGVYRMANGYNLFGGNAPGKKIVPVTPQMEAAKQQQFESEVIKRSNPVDENGNTRPPKNNAEHEEVTRNAAAEVGATPNYGSGWWYWHGGGFTNDYEKSYANLQGDIAVNNALAKNPNLSEEEQQAIKNKVVNNIRVNNPFAGYAVLKENARQELPTGLEPNTTAATDKINVETINRRKLTELENKARKSPERILNRLQDMFLSGFKPMPEGYDPMGDRTGVTHADLTNITFNPNTVQQILKEEGITDPGQLQRLTTIAQDMFNEKKKFNAGMRQHNTTSSTLMNKRDQGNEEYILPTKGTWNPLYRICAWLNNTFSSPNVYNSNRAAEQTSNAVAREAELQNDFRAELLGFTPPAHKSDIAPPSSGPAFPQSNQMPLVPRKAAPKPVSATTRAVINPEQKTYEAISQQPNLSSKLQLYNKLTDPTLKRSAYNELVAEYGENTVKALQAAIRRY